MAKIFINYRTGDGGRAPELVDERLVEVFGEEDVFRDRRSMRPGTDFPDHLRRELESCIVFLSLIGPHWLDIRDEETGMRRLDVPHDYVHDEIATALALNKVVIPVLLDSALPKAKKLPSALVGLADRQVQPLREGYAHHDLRTLIDVIQEYVPAKEPEKKPAKKPAKKRDKERGAGRSRETGGAFAKAKITRSAVGYDPVYNEHAELRDGNEKGRRPA
ncbi:toll/interleukin-1 receptor domain-containing protein [Streptomyces sp. NPDC006655]|uniref:toll/interleukin-1 receptor domain-containing protein n=1 Tax=Streptomyces sp. NPDC006655 TaxID=3156898 RepID=UPI003454DE5A